MEEREHGKEEACFWWLLDQLQGMQGQHGVRDGGGAHRPLRDDQEDLGLRQEEEARQQEVGSRRLDRIVLSLPGASRALRSLTCILLPTTLPICERFFTTRHATVHPRSSPAARSCRRTLNTTAVLSTRTP